MALPAPSLIGQVPHQIEIDLLIASKRWPRSFSLATTPAKTWQEFRTLGHLINKRNANNEWITSQIDGVDFVKHSRNSAKARNQDANRRGHRSQHGNTCWTVVDRVTGQHSLTHGSDDRQPSSATRESLWFLSNSAFIIARGQSNYEFQSAPVGVGDARRRIA